MRRTILCVGLFGLVALGARGQDMNLPDQESEFCSIVENATSEYATSEYRALTRNRDAADKQPNGIRVAQIE